MNNRVSHACVVITLLMVPLVSGVVRGQIRDSATIERILLRYDSINTTRAARLFLVDRIERRSLRWIDPLIEYLDRKGLRQIFVPEEATLLYLLSGRYRGDSSLRELVQLLYSTESTILHSPSVPQLLDVLVAYCRSNQSSIEGTLTASRLSTRELEFLGLTLYSTVIRGVRFVDDLNVRIDRFVDLSPDDTLARCADLRLRKRMESSELGAGLYFAYEAGGGPSNENDIHAHGAVFGVNLWFRSFYLDLGTAIKKLDLSSRAESSTAIEGSVNIGPDLLPGATLLRPFLGLQVGSTDNPIDVEEEIELFSSIAGVDVGTQLQYDTPPHLNLMVRGFLGLNGYRVDAQPGSLYWGVQFRIGLSSESLTIRRDHRMGGDVR